jgi:hypothetical protein
MNDKKQTDTNIKLLSNLITQNLDTIYNTCSKTAESFRRDNISLVFLKLAIEKAKPKLTEDESLNKLIKEYHRTLNSLFEVCVNRSRMIHKKNDSISLKSLSFFINIIKKEYKSALRDVQTGN